MTATDILSRAVSDTGDPAEILRALAVLVEPGSVVELRVPHTPRGTVSGYYDDVHALAQAAAPWNDKAPGIYVTLNPVNPDLLARSCNHFTEYAKHTMSDGDSLIRRWLPQAQAIAVVRGAAA